MSENNEYKLNGVSTEEPEIFGRSKSKEEIKAEKAAEKAAKKAAEKKLRAQLREEAKNQPKASRKETLTVVGILVLVVALLLGALAVQFASSRKAEKYERDESFTTYFLDNESVPELSKDGIKGVITECYYTNGGYLCVKMLLSNGMGSEQHLDDIMVEINNMETGKTIASGYTDGVADTYTIPDGGTNTYTLYIAPEHVIIRDDSLESLEYTITTTAVPVE